MFKDNENLSLLLLKARENAVACIKPALTKHSLTEQQWRVLRVLHEVGESNAQDLASQSCILSPSLSRILARLTEDGIIVRKVDSDDQRAQNIRLSAKGKRLHNKIRPVVDKQYALLESAVGKDKMNKLAKLLESYSQSGQEIADS